MGIEASMYYSFYKNVRNSAWQCLLDFGIDRLPVDLVKITRGAGIRLIRNSHVDMLQVGERARSYSDGSTWVFVYDDSLPVDIYAQHQEAIEDLARSHLIDS